MKVKLGSTRIVFLLGDYVVKVPIIIGFRRFISGVASNYREYDLSKSGCLFTSYVIFNVLGLILVSEQLEKITEEEFKAIPEKTKNRIKECILNQNEVEFNYKNIGKYYDNGQSVYLLIDAGVNLTKNKNGRIKRLLRKLRKFLNLY